MKTNYIRLIPLFLLALLLSGCSNPFVQKAGIQVSANPESKVFVNGEPVGNTPYVSQNKAPGTYSIQIVSQDGSQKWEGKVSLLGGTISLVHRDFGENENKSHSYSLSFEKLTNKKASAVSIISMPASITTSIDGKPQGFTPLSLDIEPGAHVFTFTMPGYQDKVVNASVPAGYRLVLNLSLAALDIAPTPAPSISTSSAIPSLSPSPLAIKTPTAAPTIKSATSSAALSKPYVEIQTTPTGFLRVRSEASTSSTELAQVKPGEQFPVRDIETAGWYEIEYQTGKYGYVSSTYAKLVK